MKKYILISQSLIYNKTRNELSDFIDTRLINFFTKLNYIPITISNFYSNPDVFLNSFKFSAIILTGGSDIGKFPRRDKLENNLIKYSIRKKVPLIGICRGMQMINRFFKGKLVKIDNHVKVKHLILNVKSKKKVVVNSYHNYAIYEKTMHKNLSVLHRCFKDNSIESFKHKKYKILGIMWHPEREKKFKDFDKKLIKNFIKND